MKCWAAGGIILSSVATRYQLGLLFHAGSLIVPLRASTPQGACELAMNSAFSLATSAAKEAANFALSRDRKPSCGGNIGGDGAAAPGRLFSAATGPPLSGGKKLILTNPST